MIKTAADIKQLGTILGVWAHPDDETYCSGGLMAAASQNGQKIVCVVATQGEKGVQDESRWPASELADIREQELQEAYKILGITKHECLEIEDGECDSAEHGLDDIHAAIIAYKPDTILTFGPDGLTGHTDHKTVSEWATTAGQMHGIPVFQFVMPNPAYKTYKEACEAAREQGRTVDDMFFNVDQPQTANNGECDIYLELSNELWQKKLAALKAMPSQTERLIQQLGPENYERIFRYEAFLLVD